MIWKCNACQSEIDIPAETVMHFCPKCGANAEAKANVPKNQNQIKNNSCPVCCTEIQEGDDTIVCPDCKMVYHKDCWKDNNGCATYGCPQAGCLNPPPMKVEIQNSQSTKNDMEQCIIHCPQCNTLLNSDSTFCWSCGKDITGTAVNPEDYLSTAGIILTWISVLFLPYAVLIIGILYYCWRKKTPNKAAQLNKHCWLAFGTSILFVIIYIIIQRSQA